MFVILLIIIVTTIGEVQSAVEFQRKIKTSVVNQERSNFILLGAVKVDFEGWSEVLFFFFTSYRSNTCLFKNSNIMEIWNFNSQRQSLIIHSN